MLTQILKNRRNGKRNGNEKMAIYKGKGMRIPRFCNPALFLNRRIGSKIRRGGKHRRTAGSALPSSKHFSIICNAKTDTPHLIKFFQQYFTGEAKYNTQQLFGRLMLLSVFGAFFRVFFECWVLQQVIGAIEFFFHFLGKKKGLFGQKIEILIFLPTKNYGKFLRAVLKKFMTCEVLQLPPLNLIILLKYLNN